MKERAANARGYPKKPQDDAVTPYYEHRRGQHERIEPASTKERLPFIEEYYDFLSSVIPANARVLDFGCGFNPLAAPSFLSVEKLRYEAYDAYGDLVSFLERYFKLARVEGRASRLDLTGELPELEGDVALFLKLFPTLEQIDPKATERLLGRVNAPILVISYPSRSLGGKRKGMGRTYAERFENLSERFGWSCRRRAFPNELVYVVSVPPRDT